MGWIEDLRIWTVDKLNPAQSAIFAKEPIAGPEEITDYRIAYSQIDVIHRAIEVIINAVVEVPYRVEGGGPVKKVAKLLNRRPNPFEDRVRFMRRAILDFILDGNAFFYYDGTSIYLLPANDVEIIPDQVTFVSHYEYLITDPSDNVLEVFGRVPRTREARKLMFKPDEIIHVKADTEDSIYRGVSRLKSVDNLIKLYYELISFQKQFFKNNAVPGVVLTSDNVLSTKIKERLLQQWRQNHVSMFDGARNPAILDGGLKIDKFSNINFKEMDFENSVERLQQDMSKALGVPYVLLKSGNNANISQNQKLLYEHTIVPICEQFCSAFAHFFGPDMEIEPDKLEINALRPDAKTQAQYWATLVNTGIATVNEAREQLRLECMDDEECDKIRVPQNITGSATNPSQGGRPSGSNIPQSSDGLATPREDNDDN